MHLELGGKNPVIVFDDADLDRALDAAIFMIYSINGERCTSSSRLLVQDTIREEFEAKLIERVNNIKVGHPLDPATEIGPLSPRNTSTRSPATSTSPRKTARPLPRAARQWRQRAISSPDAFHQATTRMRIAQEEIFGPVLTSIPVLDRRRGAADRQ